MSFLAAGHRRLSASALRVGLMVTGSVVAMAWPAAAQAQAAGSDAARPAQQSDPVDPSENESGAAADIIVTAQGRAERLQDIPIAVTAVTGAALENAGLRDPLGLATVVPGLSYPTSGGSSSPRIRGVGTGISLGGNENSVATYLDGVYLATSTGSVLSLNSVSQVTVLKGPQGTLFGRNATGGVIQVTTLDPSRAFSRKLDATVANLDTFGVNAYVTGALLPGVSANTSIFYYNQQDGFGRNTLIGGDVSDAETFAVRSKMAVEIGDTAAIIAVDYTRSVLGQPAGHPTYGSLPATGVPYTGGKFDSIASIDPRFTLDSGGVSLKVDQSLGDLSLMSITAYRKAKNRVIWDADRLPLFALQADNTFKDKQFSQELQLKSADNAPFKWVIGAYYFNGTGSFDPVRVFTPAAVANIVSHQKTESYAAFAQATYSLDDSTSLTGGIRYTNETKSFNGFGRTVLTNGTVLTPPAVRDSANYEQFTWRAALDHRFSSDVLAYLSYNRGFKSGGYNPQVVSGNIAPFQPELLDAIEAGIKSDWLGRRLRVNGAVYYYDYNDIQLNVFLNGLATISNAPKSKVYGVDLEIVGSPVPALDLTLGFSAIHSRFGDFPNAVRSTPQVPNGTTILGGNRIGVGNAQGNRLPYAPDWTINLGASYGFDLTNSDLRLDVNYFYSDGFVTEADNRLRQRPYNLLDASAKLSFGPDRQYSLKIWGRNLTNNAYTQQLFTQVTADITNPGPGRTFGITAGIEFKP